MNTQTTETDLIIQRINELIEQENKVNHKVLTPYRISKNGKLEASTLNKILDGTNKDIRISTIGKLCKGLNISLREFFDDDIFN